MPITLAEALELIATHCAPATKILLREGDDLLGHVLADDIVAEIDLPSFDNSAVDGYGFCYDDLKMFQGNGLILAGRAGAGLPFPGPVHLGQAVRILTGAAIPEGVDTIAMQEDVVLQSDCVVFRGEIRRGANLRRRGESVRSGARVVKKGGVIGPVECALLTAQGIESASVRAPLRIALLSTGNELHNARESGGPGMIFDSNRPFLRAALKQLGCLVTDLGIVRDDADALGAVVLGAAETHDVVISSAGASVGDQDHIRTVLDRYGSLYFHGVAIKPGRPVGLGRIRDAVFIGLPGNPAA